jgi:hypothetical protein
MHWCPMSSDGFPLFKESINQSYCPHLKLRNDPDTSLAFPSVWNYCFKAVPPYSVRMKYQAEVCQTEHFIECPVYQRSMSAALPRELRSRQSASNANLRRIWWLSLFMLLLLLALTLFGSEDFHFFPRLNLFQTFGSKSAVSNLYIFQTLTPSPPTSSWSVTISALVSPAPELQNRLTQTPIVAGVWAFVPSTGMCGYPRDTPIGTDQKFIIHRVAGEESLNGYEITYRTSARAILAINHGLQTPIPSNIVIVIPLDQTDPYGLPVFETYLAAEPNSSIEALSAKLGVDSQALAHYNNLPQPCKAFSGWLLVPLPTPTP